MTTTETDAPAPEPAAEELDAGGDAPLAIEAPVDPHKEALWTRLVLPLALPILSAVGVLLWALNLSRAFLAGGKTGSLVIVLIVTVSIMAGAAAMSAMPHLRTTSKLLIVAFVVCLIVSAGIISLGPSEEKASGGGGYVPPKGAPVGTVEVVAQPGSALSFNAKEFTAKSGVNTIKYVQGTGTHTLLFADPSFAGFQLNVGPPKTESGKVLLKKGVDYTIFCNIPGHEAAGMKATIKVG
jgi:uncharacterized cupredoxin-like copper-binding protein